MLAEPADGPQSGDTYVCRVRDVWVAPGFGAVLDVGGRAYRATAGGALACKADLSCLPPLDAAAPVLDAASVWLAWGGGFNYGHFLLDGLSSLQALDESGLLARAPPIAPPLVRWQRDLLALGFPDLKVTETPAPVCRLRQAAFASSMDHFLNAPNALLGRLRTRLLGQAPASRASGARVYFSRRGQSMRVMVDEDALEAALRARGFVIVHPERLSVAEQVAAMRGAAVVVGATGAAFANALFLPGGATVIEIQPENFRSQWVAHLCRRSGLEWFGYLCPSPLPAREAPVLSKLRRGFRFAYRLDLDEFLPFLDARL